MALAPDQGIRALLHCIISAQYMVNEEIIAYHSPYIDLLIVKHRKPR